MALTVGNMDARIGMPITYERGGHHLGLLALMPVNIASSKSRAWST